MAADHLHSRVPRPAVIGVAKMGGSFALAARDRARVDEVIGSDSDPAALELAVQQEDVAEAASLLLDGLGLPTVVSFVGDGSD